MDLFANISIDPSGEHGEIWFVFFQSWTTFFITNGIKMASLIKQSTQYELDGSYLLKRVNLFKDMSIVQGSVFLCFILKKGENTGWFSFSLSSHIKS
jgi:hypothetical protein